jgi:hypothetical protein
MQLLMHWLSSAKATISGIAPQPERIYIDRATKSLSSPREHLVLSECCKHRPVHSECSLVMFCVTEELFYF